MSTYIDKSALITGGCSGIGLELSKKMLQRGIKNLAILDINDRDDAIENLKNEFQSRNILYLQVDVSNRDEVKNAFKRAFATFKYLDIVICNAGILNEVDIQLSFNVNTIGVINTTFAALELMSKNNGGTGGIIVCNSSITALDTFYVTPVYSATKHATLGFFRTLGSGYYDEHGIKFMTVCPTIVETNITASAIMFGPAKPKNPDDKYSLRKFAALYKKQSAEACGNAIANVIALEKNDSIWIIDDGNYKEITIEKFFYNK